MRLLRMEVKKMLFYQKGWLFFLLFLLLWGGSLLFFDTPTEPGLETGKASYLYYLKQVEGQCTPEVERLISEEAGRLSAAKASLQNLQALYSKGKISRGELEEKGQEDIAALENSEGFALLFEQYTYVRENTDNRYFLYRNGWAGLLSHDQIDPLFLLLLLLIMTPIFCGEAGCGMDVFLPTTPGGGARTAGRKILLSLSTAVFLSLLLSGMRYGFFALKYGLPSGESPLQSLPYFAASSWELSLIQAFLWVTLFQLFGAMSLSLVILFLSVFVKSYALTLFCCIAGILLPVLLFPLPSTKYLLPTPLGFLIGTGFFKGTTYQRNLLTDEMTVVFQEIPKGCCGVLFWLLLLICGGMILLVVRRYTNEWQRHRRSGKRLGLLMCMSVSLSFLTGCTPPADPSISYQLSQKQQFETEQYQFYCALGTDGKRQIFCKDKKSGDVKSLPLAPLEQSSELGNCLFGQGKFLYYLRYEVDKWDFQETHSRFAVIQLDISDFSEKPVFERQLDSSVPELIKSTQQANADIHFWTGITAFFLNRDHIYFVRGDRELFEVNRWTGTVKGLASLPVGGDLFFDGQELHYKHDNPAF